MSLEQKIDAFMGKFDLQNRKNIAEAGSIYAETLSRELGEPGTKDHPSQPGEAPHRVTGNLQASIASTVENNVASVGPTASYAQYLLKTRPFLRLAYEQCAAAIKRKLLELRI